MVALVSLKKAEEDGELGWADDKLEELFKEAGTIESIRYMERDGEFKGVAFVRNNKFLQSFKMLFCC